jgi:hypothetical protein
MSRLPDGTLVRWIGERPGSTWGRDEDAQQGDIAVAIGPSNNGGDENCATLHNLRTGYEGSWHRLWVAGTVDAKLGVPWELATDVELTNEQKLLVVKLTLRGVGVKESAK